MIVNSCNFHIFPVCLVTSDLFLQASFQQAKESQFLQPVLAGPGHQFSDYFGCLYDS